MPDKLTDFRDPLQSILLCLRQLNIPHVLIGGIAVSQLSQPRATADIDLLAIPDRDDAIEELYQSAQSFGFIARIRDAVPFARENRVLLLRHQSTEIAVDVALGFLPFEKEVVARSEVRTAGDLQLPLPTVEDLVILKAVAHRPRDLQDIRMLAEANPAMDRKRVREVVGEFAAALGMPEVLDDLLGAL